MKSKLARNMLKIFFMMLWSFSSHSAMGWYYLLPSDSSGNEKKEASFMNIEDFFYWFLCC